MQTRLPAELSQTPVGRSAETILRRCVHCGFCNATCPTYLLLGDESDGPRGRIYLIKNLLEGAKPTASVRTHLDRCLTCRACETTCPSGVDYGRLLDLGREVVHQALPRSPLDASVRWVLRKILPNAGLFSFMLRCARAVRSVLPARLAEKLPLRARDAGAWPPGRWGRRMAVLAGCVQPGLAPEINAAAARVLDRLQISLEEIKAVGCCGAVNFHLEDTKAARDQARRVIDAVWPELQNGLEALVMTASGCGVFVRDYPDLLKEDPAYADKAAQIVARTFDLSEVILRESPSWPTLSSPVKLAFHSPCTLQHGQKLKGGVEGILRNRGGVLTEVADGHLCCGSAGTYSLLQSEIATRLRDARLTALERGEPEYILTANIGCLTHLQSGTTRPVMHWIDWLDQTWSDAQQKAE